MRGVRSRGLAAGALALGLVLPALAAPEVVLLGSSGGDGDPVAACGDAAASPFEAGRDGRGPSDQQIFLSEAVALCEAARRRPDPDAVRTWLARTYVLDRPARRRHAAAREASAAGNPFAAYLLAGVKLAESWQYPMEDGIALWPAAEAGFAPAAGDLALRYETGEGLAFDSCRGAAAL